MPNTVAYTAPVSGATAPTALQAKNKNFCNAVVTGDAAAVTFTITHNWNLSAADLAAGFPVWHFQPLSNAAYAANPFPASQTANSITFTCVAFTGAIVGMKIERPFSMAK